MDKEKNIKNIIESVLFVAEKPVNLKEIAGIANCLTSEAQKVINEMIEDYKNRGLRIIKKDDLFFLVTSPDTARYVAKYLNEELKKDLGQAAMEALAIVTYKQPITRIEIEKIRGVNCDGILRTLQIKGLVCEVGRKDSPGKPILYGITFDFLKHLGLESLDDLPKYNSEDNNKINISFKF